MESTANSWLAGADGAGVVVLARVVGMDATACIDVTMVEGARVIVGAIEHDIDAALDLVAIVARARIRIVANAWTCSAFALVDLDWAGIRRGRCIVRPISQNGV